MNLILSEKVKSRLMRILISKELSRLAKDSGANAIHPGYGFLAENAEFARRLEEEGIIFIGPNSKHLDMFGDKVKAREQAIKAGIPVIPGSDGPVSSVEEVAIFGETNGYPIIIKASLGGGGRGMRIVNAADEVSKLLNVRSQKRNLHLDPMKYMLRNILINQNILRYKYLEIHMAMSSIYSNEIVRFNVVIRKLWKLHLPFHLKMDYGKKFAMQQ